MSRRIIVALAATALGVLACLPLRVWADESFCAQPSQTRIPSRPASALTGSEIAARLEGIGDDAREEVIRGELLAGNIPQFLRRLRPVELTSDAPGVETAHITACVMPDYLAVGSDEDYLLVPMRLGTALSVAARFGFTLPTPALVDAIYAQSAVHLAPQPLPASAAMRSIGYFRTHDALVRAQRLEVEAVPGELISGHMKDLVLTQRLRTNLERVAIYGWHALDGRPIQPLSTVHGWHYVDYSHGVRLVSTRILVNDTPRELLQAMQDALLAPILSYEGAISEVSDLVAQLSRPHSQPAAR
ncbi:MAG TPA: hypothetical protein VK437_16630 [Steroidobacteraceae bacterium]|nr:hypothetical protein [Steroidobacteraceae bacterium]